MATRFIDEFRHDEVHIATISDIGFKVLSQIFSTFEGRYFVGRVGQREQQTA